MILQNWWYTTLLRTKNPQCPPLREHIKTDVLVVGAGMAGLHAAQYLAEKGVDVVLLERNICGGSSTGKSAGFLTPDSELELSQLIRRFGIDGARTVWEIPTQGIERIVSNVKEHDIDCDLEMQDSLFVGIGTKGKGYVEEEAEARDEMGFPYTMYQNAQELKQVNTGRGYSAGVRYGGTHSINALLYAQGLKQVLLEKGVKIYESTEVDRIEDHTAYTYLGSVTADHIIVSFDKMPKGFAPIENDTYHAQTFLSVSEPLNDKDIHAIFPEKPMMTWDSRLVYTYYRLTADCRLLLGGGSMFTTFSPMDVTTPRIINGVIADFKKRFPHVKGLDFIQYWPGRIDATKDLMPIVDYDKRYPHVQYALGCVGLPWATFSGEYAARRIVDPDYPKKYEPFICRKSNYLFPRFLEPVLGKMIIFAFNNLYSKYYQKVGR